VSWLRYGLYEPVIMVRFLTQAVCVPLLQYVKERHWGPPDLLFNAYAGSSPGIKRPGREADQSTPSITEFKNKWSYNSTPPIWSTQGKSPSFKNFTATLRYASSLTIYSQFCDMEAGRTSKVSQKKHPLQKKKSTTGWCQVDTLSSGYWSINQSKNLIKEVFKC
jgi:hypothetical protein